MFNDLSSPAALMATRRSGKPREMIAPGPDEGQLRRILGAAMRVPDHGKLFPWRFVVVPADRAGFAALLDRAYRADRPDSNASERETAVQFAHEAPCLIVILSTPVTPSKIPLWEQELSAGAACMNLLVAAHAEGFVGSWLTGWAAFSPAVAEALGGRVAGFLFLGTPGAPLQERPRPNYDAIVSTFAG